MQYVADSSISGWFLVAVSYLMAEPNIRAIAQNVAATSLWEFARLACKAFRSWKIIDGQSAQVERRQGMDSAEGLATVTLAAINSLSDHSGEITITIKTQRSKYEKTELTVKLTNETRRTKSISMPVAKRVKRSRGQDHMPLDQFRR